MAFAVDELIQTDDKEGFEWFFAYTANTLFFRPNATCVINTMEKDLKTPIQNQNILLIL